MPMPSRVLGQIENEINQRLSVTFALIRNVTRPGASTLLEGDRFLFRVTLRNDCGFGVNDVRGVIAPTPYTRFPLQSFKVGDLASGGGVEVLATEAFLRQLPPVGSVFDHVGSVRLTSGVDLSRMRFQRSEKPLACSTLPEGRDGQFVGNARRLPRKVDATTAGTLDPWGPVLPLKRMADF